METNKIEAEEIQKMGIFSLQERKCMRLIIQKIKDENTNSIYN